MSIGSLPLHIHRQVIAFGLIAVLSGCSLWNPHLVWDRPPYDAEGKAIPDPNSEVTLDQAIAYANRGKDTYREAMGDQEKLKAALALGLIPLGAAAIGLGVHEVSGEAITALGLTGAAGLGLGTWFNNENYKLIYAEGAGALVCAVEAVRPLDLDNATRTRLQGHLDGTGNPSLLTAISEVRSAKVRVEGILAIPNSGLGTLRASAEKDLAAAETLLQAAETNYDAARQLKQKVDNAAGLLTDSVDRIANEVDKGLAANARNLQSLSAIIGDLANNAGLFGVETDPSGDATGGAVDVAGTDAESIEKNLLAFQPQNNAERLSLALGILQVATIKLAQSSRWIAALVKSVEDQTPLETLEQCGVDLESLDLGIKVLPEPRLTFTERQEADGQLVLTRGTPPYYATLIKSAGENLKIDVKEEPGLSLLTVRVETGLTAGRYPVHVFDSAKGTAPVEIVVEAASGEAGGLNPPLTDEEKSFSADDIKLLQFYVGANQDSKIGRETRSKVQDCQAKRGETKTPTITKAWFDSIKAEAVNGQTCGL